jgi:argininosuccinate lyase
MRRATSAGFLNATDMADYLVKKGIPFRQAHQYVGKAVTYALGKKKELQDLSLDELKSFSPSIEDDIFGLLSAEAMINNRKSVGGTATVNVRKAIQTAKTALNQSR